VDFLKLKKSTHLFYQKFLVPLIKFLPEIGMTKSYKYLVMQSCQLNERHSSVKDKFENCAQIIFLSIVWKIPVTAASLNCKIFGFRNLLFHAEISFLVEKTASPIRYLLG